jgi:very-short-patch-repair endonuclease
LWRLDGVRVPERPDLTVPRRRAPRSNLVIVHRSLLLPDVDRTEIDGIPVTSPARTLIDLAAVLDDQQLEAVVESGFRLGCFRESFLRWRIRELGETRPGSRRLLDLLDARGRDAAALESPLEVRAWRVLVGSDLPRPVRQFSIRSGDRRYRLDFAWPEQKLAVECDGYTTHGGRAGFRRDRRKIAALAAIKWRVIPVTWEDVTRNRAQLLADVRDALSHGS